MNRVILTIRHALGVRQTNARSLSIATLLLALNSSPAASPLMIFEHSCNKYPGDSGRVECERRKKETRKALDEYSEQQKKDGTKTKKDLCFRRSSTGERVCPN